MSNETTKTIKNAETWFVTASEFDSSSNQNKNFIGNCTWDISDTDIADFIDTGSGLFYGTHQELTNVFAKQVGDTVLTCVVDGVTHTCQLTVSPHFDTLVLTWAKVS